MEKIILKRRSIRNFSQKKIPLRLLKKFVNAARIAPSAANLQPLEYLVVTKPELCKKVFKYLAWAAYITPRGNPKIGCEPTAYIFVLVAAENPSAYTFRDVGAAAENIMLLAQSFGVGTCWLGSINRDKIRSILNIPGRMGIDTVIALGYPKMKSVVAPFKGSIKYYLDKKGVLHVPKRPLKNILHINKIGISKS